MQDDKVTEEQVMSYFTTDAYKPDAVIVRRPDTARASSELGCQVGLGPSTVRRRRRREAHRITGSLADWLTHRLIRFRRFATGTDPATA